MVGNAIFVMFASSVALKYSVFPILYIFMVLKNTMTESTHAIPCAIRVANATPAIPKWNLVTKSTSSAMFRREEKTKKKSGNFDFPKALYIDAVTL